MLTVRRARVVAAAIVLSFAVSAVAQNAALQAKIDALVHEPQVARAHWGVHVTKLDGTPIVAMNEGQLFMPASNNKLFTTATTMALLGGEHRFTTAVYAEGLITRGVLDGNIDLYGEGDANFSGRTIPYVPPAKRPQGVQPPPNELRYIDELADQIKAKGITRIDGDVVGDDTLMPWQPYASDWSIDDALWYYGAPVNALMIADNAINIKIAPGANAGDAAVVTLNPALPFYEIDTQIKTVAKGTKAHTDIQRSVLMTGGSRTVHLYGTIAIGATPQSEDLAIDDPAEYAARTLKAALEARGITVTGTARAQHRIEPELAFTKQTMEPITEWAPIWKKYGEKGHIDSHGVTWKSQLLATHESDPLYQDIVVTNKVSQNQHAELLLRQLGLAIGKDGSIAQGVRVVRQFLTKQVGIDDNDFIFNDGSGLSGHDLVAPRATTQLLRYAAKQEWGAQWKASLPIGGEDGTLRNRFPAQPVKDHLFAKTGTLSEARALSGYLECASGQTVVFSIMVNLHTPRTHEDQKTMDAIVAAIQAAE